MNKKYCTLFAISFVFGIASASYSPPCKSGDGACEDYGLGNFCCNSTAHETCYQGYHSGICCTAPSVGCCGRDGSALGGCKCRSATQQCCGNTANTICNAGQTCCIDSSDQGSCCNSDQTCSNGACVPKVQSGCSQCGATDQCCADFRLGSVCFNPNTHTCATDEQNRKVLCGKGLGACNGVCYDTTLYKCVGQLVHK